MKSLKMNIWFLSLILLGSACSTGAVYSKSREFFQRQVAKPGNYEKFSVIDKKVKLKQDQSISMSSFGYNPRRWEKSQLETFHFALIWLEDPKLLDRQIYLVKQVGRSILFCHVEPQEKESQEKRKSVVYYSVFLLKLHKEDQAQVIDWPDYLREYLGADYFSHRQIRIGDRPVIQLNWDSNYYWNAPIIFVQQKEYVAQIIQLYHGQSRTRVNQIFNKFPWRTFVR